MKTRQIERASVFYRLSVKGKTARTLEPEEAAAATEGLAPSSGQIATDATNLDLSLKQSWRVSEDEFVIKIDASPLHMSAAQRMFGGGVERGAPRTDASDLVATIDDAPLHMSAARHVFEGEVEKKEASGNRRGKTAKHVFEGTAEKETPRSPDPPAWTASEKYAVPPHGETSVDEEKTRNGDEEIPGDAKKFSPRTYAQVGRTATHEDGEKTRGAEGAENGKKASPARDLGKEWESTRDLGVEWSYFWNNVFRSFRH